MITLELLTSASGTLTLPVVNHVHHRVEKFVYADDIDASSVALDYVESEPLNPVKNLLITNRTYTVPANAPRSTEGKAPWHSFYGSSYISDYYTIVATNKTVVDENGQVKPLFFRHDLPDDVVEVSIQQVTRGNRVTVDSGYLLDLSAGVIYTNYQNYFDPTTGAYVLYYVVATDSSGNAYHHLLSPDLIASEASWEDIDLDTGELTTAYPLYIRERDGTATRFTFNVTDTWYVRSVAQSLIQPLMPMARKSNDAWFLRITNGDFRASTNSDLRRYYVPEFESQPFAPSRPYVFSPYGNLEYVNDAVLKAPRDHIAVRDGLFLTILIYDYDGELLKVLTTDSSKTGLRYGNTSVVYETDKIHSVDNIGGFISLGIKLLPAWTYTAQYYYEANDYEYTQLDLNPIYTESVRSGMVVVYCIPDVDSDERAIHHLVVDDTDTILACSQGLSASYGNLQLWDSGGTVPNPDTVIGTHYLDFRENYCVGGSNTHAYMILAEIVVSTQGDFRDAKVYDVRERGAYPVDPDAIVLQNPRILQSALMDNPEGVIVPQNKVMIIEAPIDILEDYGGPMTEDEAREALLQHLDASVLPVIDWTYLKPELTVTQTASGEVELTYTWEGPGYYKIYRQAPGETVFTALTTLDHTLPPLGRIATYSDTGLTAHQIYRYGIAVIQNDVEYPMSMQVAIEV